MDLQHFWARSRWGSRFGEMRPRPAPQVPHHGLDIRAAAEERVPALKGGRVVTVGASSNIGGYLTIQVGPGEYHTYAHQKERVSFGSTVRQGDEISTVMGYGDQHGTQWTAPHLHFSTSRTRFGFSVDGDCYDPAPTISAVLAGFAGGSATPIPEDDMQADEREALFAIKGLLVDGTSSDGGSVVPFTELYERVKDVQRRIRGPLTRPWDQFDQILTVLGQRGDVDEVALAQSLAPLLAASLPKLDTDQIKQLIAALPAETVAAFKAAL